MVRFYDDSKVLEIALWYNETGEDMSSDFFEDATDKECYNEVLGAYKVEDVEYPADYAEGYVNGTNRDFEYPEDWENKYSISTLITDRTNVNEDVMGEAAADLYVRDGRSAAERDQLQKEYGLTDEETDALCKKLATYEKDEG